ncbi:hypothetical protein LEMLEM_LOCUS23892 [Lemmus lemmus]
MDLEGVARDRRGVEVTAWPFVSVAASLNPVQKNSLLLPREI